MDTGELEISTLAFFSQYAFISFVRIHVIFPVLLVSALISACATKEPEPLRVRQFHMSSITPSSINSQMVRGEQQYRLRGEVTSAERQTKLGQYYTVHWENTVNAPAPLRIIMDYQQAATGFKQLQMVSDLPVGERSGDIEFQVNGENYRRNGRVLSWRMRLMSGEQVIDEKRSYLWR